MGVNPHDQPVRPARHRRQRYRPHERALARPLAGIDDDGQMGELFHQWHSVDVHGVARHALERANAALAQDDVRIALSEDVFRGKQPLLNGGSQAALEQHRLARTADLIEQVVVLHVARANLEHIRILADQADIGGTYLLPAYPQTPLLTHRPPPPITPPPPTPHSLLTPIAAVHDSL